MEGSTAATRPPSLVALFLVFGKVGLVSFGGGSTTLVLMEQEVCRRRPWLTEHQFLFTMALSRMWPGVHLLAQSVLIGHLLRGMPGALICLFGMMVPATAIAVLFTAFWLVLRDNPYGAGAIAGVLPATAGLSFAVAYRFGRAEVKGLSRTDGALTLALAIGSFVLMALLNVSSLVTVLGAGVLAVFLFRPRGERDGPA
jgi:chromate transporter